MIIYSETRLKQGTKLVLDDNKTYEVIACLDLEFLGLGKGFNLSLKEIYNVWGYSYHAFICNVYNRNL